MKADVLLMTLSSIILWVTTAAHGWSFGPNATTFVLLYLSVGALFALGMCADLLRLRQTERGTVLVMWLTQTVTWLPWNLTYAARTLHRIYMGRDES